MAFNDLVRKSGKGLEASKELVVALEVNLGGTCGTQYFADKNITIEGTYYDGRLMSASSVNRRIFPDVGSFEISDLEINLANYDNEFYKPKWTRWSHGQSAKLRLAFYGTRNIVQSDFTTRYNGIISQFSYDFDNNFFNIGIKDRGQISLDKLIPPHLIGEDDFPGMDTNLLEVGRPLPYVYGRWVAGLPYTPDWTQTIPGLLVGTYTQGTAKILFADHASDTSYYMMQNGNTLDGTWIFYKSGTISSYGTRPVTYIDLNHDPGTNTISAQIAGTTGWRSEIIRLLLERAGLTWPDDFGTASFEDVHDKEGEKSHNYLDKQRPAKEWIDDLCLQENYCLFFTSDGKAKIGERTNLENQFLKDVVVKQL